MSSYYTRILRPGLSYSFLTHTPFLCFVGSHPYVIFTLVLFFLLWCFVQTSVQKEKGQFVSPVSRSQRKILLRSGPKGKITYTCKHALKLGCRFASVKFHLTYLLKTSIYILIQNTNTSTKLQITLLCCVF